MSAIDKLVITAQDPDDRPCSMTVHVPRRVRNQFDRLSDTTNIPRDDFAGMAMQFALERMEVQEAH